MFTLPAKSRFCDGLFFGVLYCTPDFETAFLETVVRDRLKGQIRRVIPWGEIENRCVFNLETAKERELLLLDLRKTGCTDIGVSTDTVQAKSHQSGRALSTAIHNQHSDIDGILFSSRLTGRDNYVIFDRATHKLASGQITALKDHPELEGILDERNIRLA